MIKDKLLELKQKKDIFFEFKEKGFENIKIDGKTFEERTKGRLFFKKLRDQVRIASKIASTDVSNINLKGFDEAEENDEILDEIAPTVVENDVDSELKEILGTSENYEKYMKVLEEDAKFSASLSPELIEQFHVSSLNLAFSEDTTEKILQYEASLIVEEEIKEEDPAEEKQDEEVIPKKKKGKTLGELSKEEDAIKEIKRHVINLRNSKELILKVVKTEEFYNRFISIIERIDGEDILKIKEGLPVNANEKDERIQNALLEQFSKNRGMAVALYQIYTGQHRFQKNQRK